MEELVDDPHHARENAMAERLRNKIATGKFDLLATYTYAKALVKGSSHYEAEQEARQCKRAWLLPSWEPRCVQALLTRLVAWSGALS
jgi:hypothetical protein